MGGKRPDQYQIDPGEAGATDYKFRDEDEGIRTQDKQDVARTRARDKESLIPRGGTNPALADLQQRRAERRDEEAADQDAEEGGRGPHGEAGESGESDRR